jgi:hypothetical protein
MNGTDPREPVTDSATSVYRRGVGGGPINMSAASTHIGRRRRPSDRQRAVTVRAV